MEYIVSIAITLLFIALYYILKPQGRESFTKSLTDDQFTSELSALAKQLNLPDKNNKKEYNVSQFMRKTKRAYSLAKKFSSETTQGSLYIPELKNFVELIEENMANLKEVSKIDFSKLNDLPSKSGISRIENLYRCILESNNFLLDSQKITFAFDIFNRVSTITYPEIKNCHIICTYLFLEKLSFVSTRVINLIKLAKYSKQVSSYSKFYENRKLYKNIKTNNVFLHFSAVFQNLDCPSADLVYFDVIENITSTSRIILGQLKNITPNSFLQFYSPLKIFQNIKSFSTSSAKIQSAFLTELSSQSSRLNIDELAYAHSLIRYMNREEPLTLKSTQVKIFNRIFTFSVFDSNIKTLATALKSPIVMSLIFSKKKAGFKRAYQ